MLHRTHHPFYFPSISSKFISPSLSTATSASTTTTTTTTATSQVVKEMECMMKGGFRPEMMVGFSPKQVISDDSCISNSQNAAPVSVAGEDFFVDQLLNLKDEDKEDKEDDNGLLVVVKDEPLEEIEAPYTMKVSTFLSPSLETERNRDDFTSVLSIPAEEADLEWLSHFVEDSFSQFSTPYPAGHGPILEQTNPNPEPGSDPKKAATHALSKSRRSKRARTGGRVWSTALADSSHSSPSTTSSSDPSSPNPVPARRKRECGPPRRCSHCGVQKTPQWRAGPLGPKTLCNACGVRYKSGRLLPEYRPACSPTFSSEFHSNNHRKVLEMRKKRVGGHGSARTQVTSPGSEFWIVPDLCSSN